MDAQKEIDFLYDKAIINVEYNSQIVKENKILYEFFVNFLIFNLKKFFFYHGIFIYYKKIFINLVIKKENLFNL